MKSIIINEKGITLIALVTTIIILLILSSIAIGTLGNNNGVINKSNENNQIAQKESIIEKIEADLYSEKTITGKIPNETKLVEIAKKYGTVDETNKKINITGTNYEINFGEIEGWSE